MNSNQISDLTADLIGALNTNYDVINMDAVLTVISTLEVTTITKEQLEATRLAKYINQLRRRTNNDNLARRAKSLLKKWRKMVGMQQPGSDITPKQQTSTKPINADVPIPQSALRQTPASVEVTLSVPQTVTTFTSFNIPKSGFDNQDVVAPYSATDNFVKMQHQNVNLTEVINNLNFGNNSCQGVDYKEYTNPKCSETFVIDHSSNSNSRFNFIPSEATKNVEAPIIIDIDSDSGDVETTSTQTQFKPSVTITPIITESGVKLKKSKKEKKRKEKDSQRKVEILTLQPEQDSNQTLASHKKFLQLPTITTEDNIVVNVRDEKFQPKSYPIASNMSEVLSLSNSSMSSMFPTDSSPTVLTAKKNLISNMDLSFAGKFNSHNSGGETVFPIEDVVVSNGPQKTIYVMDEENQITVENQPKNQNIIMNEEESTSSSHVSRFGIGDVAKENNITNQTKLTDEGSCSAEQILTFSNVGFTNITFQSSNIEPNDNLETKMPKKRGRKKGSKGVDSLLVKETSLSQQIFSSGSKKVKTTKELFNEIQNRKLGATINQVTESVEKLDNWQNTASQQSKKQSGVSRPESSCSESPLHSPPTLDACYLNVIGSTAATRSSPDMSSNLLEDALDTDSDSNTSGLTQSDIKLRKIRRTNSIDSNFPHLKSNAKVWNSVKSELFQSPGDKIAGIEIQLKKMLMQLPLPENVSTLEANYLTQQVPCTCRLVEEMSQVNSKEADQLLLSKKEILKKGFNTETPFNSSPIKTERLLQNGINKSDVEISTSAADFSRKPKKSIFDFDFDEDEDPLQALLAETATLTGDYIDNVKEEQLNDLETNDLKLKALTTTVNEENCVVTQRKEISHLIYRIEEDEGCEAKAHYEERTNKITMFHIDSLHNYYIPNVNGNWDDDLNNFSPEVNDKRIYAVTTGADVVPMYGSLINDVYIPKDLSHLSSFKDNKLKRAKDTRLKFCNVPFLGVAKLLPSCRRAKYKLRRQSQAGQMSYNKNIEQVEDEVKLLELNHTLSVNVNEVGNSEVQTISISSLIEPTTDDYTSHDLLTVVPNVSEPETILSDVANQVNNEGIASNNINFYNEDTSLNQRHYSSSRSESSSNSHSKSSCSSSSLKKTQNCINKKLRRQRLLLRNEVKQENQTDEYDNRQATMVLRKRRKRSKLQTEYDNGIDSANLSYERYTGRRLVGKRIKRIKIAINGDIATQRQISSFSSSNDDGQAEEYVHNLSDKHNICQDNEGDEVEINVNRTVDSYDVDQGDCDAQVAESSSNNIEDGEYAIVQKVDGMANNHLVLTIKKTPSKTNSPVNSNAALSPVTMVTNSTALFNEVPFTQNTHSLRQKTDEELSSCKVLRDSVPSCNNSTDIKNITDNRRRRKKLQSSRRKLSNLLKHVFRDNLYDEKVSVKIHQRLFFPHELYVRGAEGEKLRILNCSSCENSCAEESEYEYSADSTTDHEQTAMLLSEPKCETEKIVTDDINLDKLNLDIVKSCTTSTSGSDDIYKDLDTDEKFDRDVNENNSDVKNNPENIEDETNDKLPFENNGLLQSFNVIYSEIPHTHQTVKECDVKELVQLNSQQNIENCDDYKNLYYNNNNNNNLNIIKHKLVNNTNCIDNCSKDTDQPSQHSTMKAMTGSTAAYETTQKNTTPRLAVRKEYRTGIRYVNEDVDQVGEKCTHVQHFKEWHQVLKIRSYNNELLTVLPYVVLD